VQFFTALVTNGYWQGFARLDIYQGLGKQVCVPFLNCYSCPGALAACPLGTLQFFLASFGHAPSLYVVGLLVATGAGVGRLVCGWLCPFGLLQELGARLLPIKFPVPKALTRVKYILLLLTLAFPVVWVDPYGLGAPYFCQLVCPAGTLEAGLPLGLGRPELRAMLGWLFAWKVFLLAGFLVATVFTYRPFCRTACPLGALYGLFNPVSLGRLEVDTTRCHHCGACRAYCPLDLDVRRHPNHPECIRCLICLKGCLSGALVYRAGFGRSPRRGMI
jgi:polyferredoxin